MILTIPLSISSNMTLQAKKIGQSPQNLFYEFEIRREFAIRLTGIERGYFSGKTLRWDYKLANMGFIASYPTSYRLIHDP
jgi:hypothetical protein